MAGHPGFRGNVAPVHGLSTGRVKLIRQRPAASAAPRRAYAGRPVAAGASGRHAGEAARVPIRRSSARGAGRESFGGCVHFSGRTQSSVSGAERTQSGQPSLTCLFWISCDAFHLNPRVDHQPAGTQSSPCRVRLSEMLFVDFVERAPFSNVCEKHCAFDHAFHGQPAPG